MVENMNCWIVLAISTLTSGSKLNIYVFCFLFLQHSLLNNILRFSFCLFFNFANRLFNSQYLKQNTHQVAVPKKV